MPNSKLKIPFYYTVTSSNYVCGSLLRVGQYVTPDISKYRPKRIHLGGFLYLSRYARSVITETLGIDGACMK